MKLVMTIAFGVLIGWALIQLVIWLKGVAEKQLLNYLGMDKGMNKDDFDKSK